MPSPRWLVKLAVPVVAAATVLANAAIATADPADDAYLTQLRALGFTWPPDHDAALIGMGRLICDDLGWGWTYDQIARDIHSELDQRNVTYGQVESMVGLAHSTYCPTQRCWAAHC